METFIPFSGFYQSIHDNELDYAFDQIFSSDSGEKYQGLAEKAFDAVNWLAVHNEYAAKYTEGLSEKLSLKTLKFIQVDSPKYYNFSTDRILCEISESEVEELYNRVSKESLQKSIKDQFTSRSGFISFYPNDLNKWPEDVKQWDYNQIQVLFEVLLNSEDDFDSIKELECLDNYSEICYHILCEHTAPRFLKISYYLREREYRHYEK